MVMGRRTRGRPGFRPVVNVLLAATLAAGGLAGAVPAVADETPVPMPVRSMDLPDTDRGKAVAFWRDGGAEVRAAAEVALAGSDAEVTAFLNTGRGAAENADDRQMAMDLVTGGGRKLREAAQAALNGTPQQLHDFLDTGWRAPLETDQKIEAARLVGEGGRHVREAGQAALNGSADDIRAFLKTKYPTLKDLDDRIAVARITGEGGPATQAAGRAALEGPIDDVRDFLAVGRYVSQARDLDYTNVTTLAAQASDSATTAGRETDAAKDASDQAVQAAQLAKQAAAQAAAETAAAQNDAAKAAAAANRAAAATRRAAQAAQSAIAAARAANAAARDAARAAADASQIASTIEQYTAKAREAAAAAATDATKADDAKKAAQDVRDHIKDAADIVDMGNRAKTAGDAAFAATAAANDAVAQVKAAEQSSLDAAATADAVGASSAEARAAADAAHRHVQEAARATAAVTAFADQARAAAAEAIAAVNSAIAHGNAAAQAAEAAAVNAGHATDAAAQATAHADAATQAADASTAAADKAKAVHALAAQSEAEDLASRTNEAVATAQDQKVAFDTAKAAATQTAADRKALADRAQALAADAAKPDADPQRIAADGRKMAIAVLRTGGPWALSAAEFALAQSDDAIRDYARTGWQKANEADERQRTLTIAWQTDQPDLAQAALTAFDSDPAAVHTFLTTGQHQVAATEYRKQIVRIIGEGGRKVQEAGRAALDANTLDALLQFLNSGQFAQRETDDRIEIARLVSQGGPEVQAAGRIALEGPPIMQRRFLTLGQYTARHKDQLAAAHNAQIQSVISQAYANASTAQQQAFEARAAAARARNAAAEAQGYADQAQQAAAAAADAVTRARDSAAQASLSAAEAVQAVHAATAAQASAQQASDRAQESSARAAATYTWAQGAAANADNAAAQARHSAELAHASAVDAGTAATNAYDTLETYEMIQRAYDAMQMQQIMSIVISIDNLSAEDYHQRLDIIGAIPVPGAEVGANGINCAWYAVDGQWSDAAMSCLAAIPVLGETASAYKAAKWAKKGEKILDAANEPRQTKTDLTLQAASCMTDLGNSFPAGTKVLMADRTTRPIEQIRTGDTVLATNPLTRETLPERVDGTITTPNDVDFTEIDVLGPNNTTGTITATDHHPFWSQTANNWVYASGLVRGTLLRTPDGTTAQVTAVRYREAWQTTYNLTVHDLNTYYVQAGTAAVLVHNKNKPVVMPNLVKLAIDKLLAGQLSQRRWPNGDLDFFSGKDLQSPGMKRFWSDYDHAYDENVRTPGVVTRIYTVVEDDDRYRLIVREAPGEPKKYAWVAPGSDGVHNYGRLIEFDPSCPY
ncbi:polymorphic toxin-type HINT domain-containing protein [Kitasatospora sp. NRRL B-11411]|uniref:polymorphic toxin-type HINT domain-containing protein n=1 Tax=Kitasatospora sp. NRRL B-11411 TaxID=1463822 RepID=UPI0009DD3026|nr:polymorphic toxin-type HINT domain-containing protein [Kitasatospora sp. NRRL B-11411]